MDCSPSGSSIHGIFQARVLEWGAIVFSKTKSNNVQKITLQPSGIILDMQDLFNIQKSIGIMHHIN